MDYEYHIDYWTYERDKRDVDHVRPRPRKILSEYDGAVE